MRVDGAWKLDGSLGAHGKLNGFAGGINPDNSELTCSVCVTNPSTLGDKGLVRCRFAGGFEERLGNDILLVRIHFIEMIWWTALAPREFEFPLPGSLPYTYLPGGGSKPSNPKTGALPPLPDVAALHDLALRFHQGRLGPQALVRTRILISERYSKDTRKILER